MVYIPSLTTRYDMATQQEVPVIDLNPAAAYGELRVLASEPVTERDVDRVRVDIEPGDYILAVGDVVLLAALIAHAISRNGSVNVLRWDKYTRDYNVWEVK